MDLGKKLKKENIFIADSFEDTGSFYAAYAVFLKERGIITDSDTVKRLFVKREKVHSTAIKKGAAAPHVFSDQFSEFTFSIALIKNGMDFKAPDEENVFLVFILMSGEREVGLHLKSLAHIARLVQKTTIVEDAKSVSSCDELYNLILEKETQI